MNQALHTYIGSVKKGSEAYPEQNTLHFLNSVNISVKINSITPKKKQNGIEEDCQENCHIPLGNIW